MTELLKLAGNATQPTEGDVVGPKERRLVALGDTLNLAPAAVVALDQALATQDAVVRARTLTALDRLRRSGSTVLLASHEDRLLEDLCDEVWWLEAGQLAAKGDPKETLVAVPPLRRRTHPKLGRNDRAASGSVRTPGRMAGPKLFRWRRWAPKAIRPSSARAARW